MNRDASYDVVVIGGGPGGSTASTLLKKAGCRVALVEREKFPRYQIGESLLPATIHGICKLLGVEQEVENAGFVRKAGGTFRWGRNDEPWTFDFGSGGVNLALDFSYSYQVERARFDAILLDNARRNGVEVFEECAAQELLQDRGRVFGLQVSGAAGERNLLANWVVDASGNQSRFHRRAGERIFSKFFQNVAVFCYFEGAGRLPAPNSTNIFCCSFPQGWFWYIPLSDTLTSVGAVVGREHSEALQSGPEQAMQRLIEQCPRIEALLAPGRLVTTGMYGKHRLRKDYSYCNTRFWTPGLALIGDAACFVDPVFSTGVHLATYSGLLVARSIATALRGSLPEVVCMNLFERSYRAEFAAFHDFLVGFYDLQRDQEAYFWKAKSVLHTEDSGNEAFLRLVAGAGTTAEEFIRLRSRTADMLEMQLGMGGRRSDDRGIENLVEQMEVKTTQFLFRNHQQRKSTVGHLLLQAHGQRVDGEEPYGASSDGLFWTADEGPRFFGQYLVLRQIVTAEQLAESLDDQRSRRRTGDRPPIGEILMAKQYLSSEQLSAALSSFHQSIAGDRYDPSLRPTGDGDRDDQSALIESVEHRLRGSNVPVKIESAREFWGLPPVGEVSCECDFQGRDAGAIYLAQTARLSRCLERAPGDFLASVVSSAQRALGSQGRRFTHRGIRSLATPAEAKAFLDAVLWRIHTPEGLAMVVVGTR